MIRAEKTISYSFLKESSLKKFYEEHKDGGRIIWDNK